jgi:hypothetical protein
MVCCPTAKEHSGEACQKYLLCTQVIGASCPTLLFIRSWLLHWLTRDTRGSEKEDNPNTEVVGANLAKSHLILDR